jgi:hypothetical protein
MGDTARWSGGGDAPWGGSLRPNGRQHYDGEDAAQDGGCMGDTARWSGGGDAPWGGSLRLGWTAASAVVAAVRGPVAAWAMQGHEAVAILLDRATV